MNSRLYLSAHSDARVYLWHGEKAAHETSLSEAAQRLGAHEVQLILPMEMCSWLLTEPWPGRRRPSVQALAFAVEDQLADDLDELHIAVGPVDAQRRYPLLVIHRQRFKNLLALLHERGLNVVSVYVDADLLPREQPSIAWWDGRWLAGGALDLRLALNPQTLEALKDGPLGTAVEHTFNPGSTPLGAINLLQGEFRRTSQRLPWRGVSVAALLIFTMAVGASQLRSRFLENEAARVYALSEQHFKSLYPEQTRIVDLSAQLKALQQQSAALQNGHMARLLQLTQQVIGASSVDVQRMEWRATVGWTLNITANSFTELEQLRERGLQSALPITVGNASQQGNRVQALLTLEDVL
ncbi:type II secretion system protein GspL [Pseudomonas sp. 7P_10.2_Bac1]|uniref:type II secretion system protein GspL n=1 Tax=Pseudomonas sp. 7P_10.2_Bac1 TaxID=2971614 RepID=UPI0021C5AD18|nr:type II secretion system protein GspL [Pseudomonas sp. 7P_10.2_Bac1]MCU1725703.1 type II secretion system protein GspL [Pseudomonas sp. 7P_10.2_Bac1]